MLEDRSEGSDTKMVLEEITISLPLQREPTMKPTEIEIQTYDVVLQLQSSEDKRQAIIDFLIQQRHLRAEDAAQRAKEMLALHITATVPVRGSCFENDLKVLFEGLPQGQSMPAEIARTIQTIMEQTGGVLEAANWVE
jgi:hypothetical protein